MTYNPPPPYNPPPYAPPPGGYPAPLPPPAPGASAPPAGPRRFGIFRAMALTSFSPDVWRDVARNWRGIGLMYMLVLLLLTWGAETFKIHSSFAKFVDKEAPEFVDQIPAVTITKGFVSIDKPEPYVIRDPKTKKVFAVIDTTGGTTEPPADFPSVLVTRSAIMQRKNAHDVETHDLSKVESFSMNKQDAYRWLNAGKAWFVPVFLPFVVLFSFIGRLVLMLIAAGIGMGLAAMFNANIPFAAMMRLSALAMTPTMVLSTVLMLLGVPDFWNLIGIAIVIGYLAMMVKANAEQFSAMGAGGYPPGYLPPPPGQVPFPAYPPMQQQQQGGQMQGYPPPPQRPFY